MANSVFTPNPQNHSTGKIAEEERLFYVTNQQNQLITLKDREVINFIKNSAKPDENVVITLDDGYIWKLNNTLSKLMVSGYIHYSDLYSLQIRISEQTFVGRELFDLEAAKIERTKIWEEWRAKLAEGKHEYVSRDRDRFLDYLGVKFYGYIFDTKVGLKRGRQELNLLEEILNEKRNFPLFKDDICKILEIIGLVKELYLLYIKIQSAKPMRVKTRLQNLYNKQRHNLIEYGLKSTRRYLLAIQEDHLYDIINKYIKEIYPNDANLQFFFIEKLNYGSFLCAS